MIEIVNLNVKKGNKFLLKNINLKVEKFGLNGIIGANGAGKSTFLRSNKNLDSNFKQNFGHALLLNTKQKDKNSSGIYFNGTNLWELNYKEKSKFISFLPQFMEFLDIEIDEFLTLSRRKFCGNFLNKKDREKITKIVNDFNLNIPRYVDTYEPEQLPDMKILLKELEEIRQEERKTMGDLYEMLGDLVGPVEDMAIIGAHRQILLEDMNNES